MQLDDKKVSDVLDKHIDTIMGEIRFMPLTDEEMKESMEGMTKPVSKEIKACVVAARLKIALFGRACQGNIYPISGSVIIIYDSDGNEKDYIEGVLTCMDIDDGVINGIPIHLSSMET